MRVKIEDHRTNEGGTVNWKTYKAAQKANGEICSQCSAHIMLGGGGYEQLCYDCKNLITDKKSVTHEEYIRCPHCEFRHQPSECDMYEAYQDGDHEVDCHSCGERFEFSTSVSYSFESPAVIEKPVSSDS